MLLDIAPDQILEGVFDQHHNILLSYKGSNDEKYGEHKNPIKLQNIMTKDQCDLNYDYRHFSYVLNLGFSGSFFNMHIENFYAIISLYDVCNKQKISENYYFDLRDGVNTKHNCKFNITFPTKSIYLVIRFEKALQKGEISEISDPYTKLNIDHKIKEKLRNNLLNYATSAYRMPFAWTALNVYQIIKANNSGNEMEFKSNENHTFSIKVKDKVHSVPLLRNSANYSSLHGTSNNNNLNENDGLQVRDKTQSMISEDNNNYYSSSSACANTPQNAYADEKTVELRNTGTLKCHQISSKSLSRNSTHSYDSSICSSTGMTYIPTFEDDFINTSTPSISAHQSISLTTNIKSWEDNVSICTTNTNTSNQSNDMPYNNNKITKRRIENNDKLGFEMPCALCQTLLESDRENNKATLQKPTVSPWPKFKPFTFTVDKVVRQDSEKISDDDLIKHILETKSPINEVGGDSIGTTASIISAIKKGTGFARNCIPINMSIDISAQTTSACLDLTSKYATTLNAANISTFNNDIDNGVTKPLSIDLPQELAPKKLHPNCISSPSSSLTLYLYPKKVNFANYGKNLQQQQQTQNVLSGGTNTTTINNTLNDTNCHRVMNETLTGNTNASMPLNSNSSANNASSARNIVVKIELRKGEGIHSVLPCIVGRDGERLREIYTTVLYHNRTPEFYDEIKFDIPLHHLFSDENLHIFFTFYHIKLNNAETGKLNDETLYRKGKFQYLMPDNHSLTSLGYTWLPLLSYQQFVFRTGPHSLPISLDKLPNHYSNIDPHTALPSIRWLDAHKPAFDCELLVNSTLFTTESRTNIMLYLRHMLTTQYNNANALHPCFQAFMQKYILGNHHPYLTSPPLGHDQRRDLASKIDLCVRESLMALKNLTTDTAEHIYPVLFTLLDEFVHFIACQYVVCEPSHDDHLISWAPLAFESLAYMVEFLRNNHGSRGKTIHSVTTEMNANNSKNLPINCDFTSNKHFYEACLNAYINSWVPEKTFSKMVSHSNPLIAAEMFDQPAVNEIPKTYGTLGRKMKKGFSGNISLDYEDIYNQRTLSSTNNLSNNKNEFTTNIGYKLDFDKNDLSKHDFNQLINKQSHPSFGTAVIVKQRILHEEIALQWVVSSGDVKENSLNNSYIFFNLIIQSMIHYKSQSQHTNSSQTSSTLMTINTSNCPNKCTYSQPFLDDLSSLIGMVSAELHQRLTNTPNLPTTLNDKNGKSKNTVARNLIYDLNYNIGHFIGQLMELLDCEIVVSLIATYVKSFEQFSIVDTNPTDVCICQNQFINSLILSVMNRDVNDSKKEVYTKYLVTYIIKNLLESLNMHVTVCQKDAMENVLLIFSVYEIIKESTLQKSVKNSNFNYQTLVTNQATLSYVNLHGANKGNLITIFLPFLNICIDAVPQMSKTVRQLMKDISLDGSITDDKGESSSFGSPLYAIFFNEPNRLSLTDDIIQKLSVASSYQLSEEFLKTVLLGFIWLLENLTRESLLQFWSQLSLWKLGEFLELIYISIVCLCNAYIEGQKHTLLQKVSTERIKAQLKESILGTKNARSCMIARSKDNEENKDSGLDNKRKTGGPTTPLRWKKESWKMVSHLNPIVQAKSAPKKSDTVNDSTSYTSNILKFCDENTEFGENILHIVLNTLDLFIEFTAQHEHDRVLVLGIIRIILVIFSTIHVPNLLERLFEIQRALINKYPDIIFEEEREICYELCRLILLNVCSDNSTIRCQAIASIYHLMFKNYEEGNSFTITKIYLTTAMSELLAYYSVELCSASLRIALKTVEVYTNRDTHMRGTSFPAQVHSILEVLGKIINHYATICPNLQTTGYNYAALGSSKLLVITSTSLCAENAASILKSDPENCVDVMYELVRSYVHCPNLKLAWLQNLAAFHSGRSCHSEAAQCLLHASALVNEFLQIIEHRRYLPKGAVSYLPLSHNIPKEETIVIKSPSSTTRTSNISMATNTPLTSLLATTSDDMLTYAALRDDETTFNSKYFSESGLIGLLEQSASSLNMASEFEIVNEVYKLLIPIHEHYTDAKKLASIHGKLHEIFSKIVQRDEKRMALQYGATYFRVGFYGKLFAALDGKEYIYKEPAVTKLSEITHRLTTQYSKILDCPIECIKDSNLVKREYLEDAKCYIQITFVEPYLDISEETKCPSSFYRNYNIRRFIFATPFTKSGRSHGSLDEQYKRKTILTTQHSFPYIKTRILVIDKEQIVLTPIEVAIEDMENKCAELTDATCKQDAKILAMVLQGSLGPTVNMGPLYVAHTFLLPVIEGKTIPTMHHNKLRISFKLFLNKCQEALTLNKHLCHEDQRDYQEQIERNYKDLQAEVFSIINNKITQNFV